MDRELKTYLDEKFGRVEDRFDSAEKLHAEQIANIHGRIDTVTEDHKRLSGRLWGIAAAALTALVGALVALATGHPAP